ncbi:recombinase [Flavobacterium caeni]|uniref:Site-specific recombinase n=1 Tax=Flavobacterium caeni TaxID=490189 RepID=A0A1G5H0R7_9FLAO|nr:recombinase [Flavobacterium caeni]SCY57445.1 Site-specific recombinase [Flavobacterium caeni]
MRKNSATTQLTPVQWLEQKCGLLPDWSSPLDALVEWVQTIRPKNPSKVDTVDLSALLSFFAANPECAAQFSGCVKEVLRAKQFSKFLSDAAILQDVDFLFELRRRLSAKLLPYQPQKDRLDFVLNQVFYLATDIDWIQKIPREQLSALFDVLQFPNLYESADADAPLSEMMIAMDYIIQRISGRAMENEVIKMVPEFDGYESPFSAFEIELLQIEERIKSNGSHALQHDDLSYRQLQVLHAQCEEFVEKAFANSAKYGISLRVNQHLLRIRQQLKRLKVLMPLLVAESNDEKKENTIALSLRLIEYNCYKNNVRRFIAESTQLLSYEITQHTAKTGEHYITESRREYFKMFWAALGGGLVVGILCILKLLLANVDASFFGHAFLYSMNYACGFIAIYLLSFTLATKQPAMTASALVRALEEGAKQQGHEDEKYYAFAVLFARVARSQFIAFVGNVVMAFPVSLLGVWAIDQLFGVNIAASKWPKLSTDLSPVHSLAIWHAAIAGVYLFLSGIISGSIANRDKHNQVYYRIEEHPILKRTFGKAKTKTFAKWYEKRWAGITSNFWFGVFMGSTVPVGLFLGLNLDVRHITFASGNLALALFGADWQLGPTMLFWAILGIGVIGFVNFMVSFGLSLGLAFRSRGMAWSELGLVWLSVWQHFKFKPSSFFVPSVRKVRG